MGRGENQEAASRGLLFGPRQTSSRRPQKVFADYLAAGALAEAEVLLDRLEGEERARAEEQLREARALVEERELAQTFADYLEDEDFEAARDLLDEMRPQTRSDVEPRLRLELVDYARRQDLWDGERLLKTFGIGPEYAPSILVEDPSSDAYVLHLSYEAGDTPDNSLEHHDSPPMTTVCGRRMGIFRDSTNDGGTEHEHGSRTTVGAWRRQQAISGLGSCCSDCAAHADQFPEAEQRDMVDALDPQLDAHAGEAIDLQAADLREEALRAWQETLLRRAAQRAHEHSAETLIQLYRRGFGTYLPYAIDSWEGLPEHADSWGDLQDQVREAVADTGWSEAQWYDVLAEAWRRRAGDQALEQQADAVLRAHHLPTVFDD